MNDNYEKYVSEHGIISSYAYKHLTQTKFHPNTVEIKDSDIVCVRIEDALEAIKIAEKDLIDEQEKELKSKEKEESWFMKIINHLFCNHDWEKLDGRSVSTGSGNVDRRVIKEIILYKCNKCGKLHNETFKT